MDKESKRLNGLFAPETIAVFGVSLEGQGIGNTIFTNLKEGTERDVFAVNPESKEEDVDFFKDINDVPTRVDLAILAIPSSDILKTVERCIDEGVKSFLIVSAGFSEMGEEGEKNARALKRLVSETGTSVLGPNTLGLYRPAEDLDTLFVSEDVLQRPKKGDIAFVSQSGFLSVPFFEYLNEKDMGLSAFVGVGNKLDLDELDMLRYFARDEETEVIAFYLESFSRGRAFFEEAERVSREKPVVLLKGGLTAEGKEATRSHTGSLSTSSERVIQGIAEQTGVILAKDEMDLVDTAASFSRLSPMEEGRIAVVSSAGGTGVIASDRIGKKKDLEMASLSPSVKAELEEVAPPLSSLENPIDLTPAVSVKNYEEVLKILGREEKLDGILLYLSKSPEVDETLPGRIIETCKKIEKPTAIVLLADTKVEEWKNEFNKEGILTFSSTRSAVATLEKLASRGKFLNKTEDNEPGSCNKRGRFL
ncbi:MAG: CoA-binding protein [Candidatus Thermoplasmatota archaeon]|nr:CoA-binding protein [Candidatus Thermoplasmatota archaeon]